MDSILNSIKKLLGIGEADTSFDTDVIMHINSALMRLMTLGVGPKAGVVISDSTTVWSALLGTRTDLEGAKVYVHLKVRLLFDPPTSSFVLDSMKSQIAELESILNMQVETNPEVVV